MLATAILALAAQVAAADLPMKVTTTAKDHYQIDVGASFDETEMDQVKARLVSLGTTTCGSLTLRWGRFTYNTVHTTDGKAMITDMIQRFECIDPATDPYKPAPADWKPTEADERASKAAAERYIRAVLAGDAKAGIAMYEPIAEVDEAAWRNASGGLADAGSGSFEVQRLDWSVNPAGMAHPGAYVTYAIQGRYSNLAVMCGALLLYRTQSGQFQITQQSLVGIRQAAVDRGAITLAQAKSYCGGG